MTMSPEDALSELSPRTRAILPAHVFSVMADMPAFRHLARENDLALIEDAAVAQARFSKGVPAGCWGDVGVFSFFQVKSFGTIGEGGLVVTDDAELADACRELRNHGQRPGERFLYRRLGFNYRMDELVAAFQLLRLPTFDDRLARRAEIAAYYDACFAHLSDRGVQARPPIGTAGATTSIRCWSSEGRTCDRFWRPKGSARTSTTRFPSHFSRRSPRTSAASGTGRTPVRPVTGTWDCRSSPT